MRHLKVQDSDIIEAVGFESVPKTSKHGIGAMEVIFKSTPDVVYRYEDVGHDTFVQLLSSESIGKTFHALFRATKHPFTKSNTKPDLKK